MFKPLMKSIKALRFISTRYVTISESHIMRMQPHDYERYGAKFSNGSTIEANGTIFNKCFEMDGKLYISGISKGQDPTYCVQEAHMKGKIHVMVLSKWLPQWFINFFLWSTSFPHQQIINDNGYCISVYDPFFFFSWCLILFENKRIKKFPCRFVILYVLWYRDWIKDHKVQLKIAIVNNLDNWKMKKWKFSDNWRVVFFLASGLTIRLDGIFSKQENFLTICVDDIVPIELKMLATYSWL